MKVDWDKARLIAAHRFEDIIIACSNHDENAIRDLMESGLAWSSKEYILEDGKDDKRYKYLDDYHCFITDNGYTCMLIQFCTPNGNKSVFPYLATKQDNKIIWVIVPYEIEVGPEFYKNPAILYTDALANAIHTTIDNLKSSATVFPALYDEVIANAVVK